MPRRSNAAASRSSAPVTESKDDSSTVQLSKTEEIFQAVNTMYDGSKGIEQMSAFLGLNFLRPRKKVNVMIMGNHSAGKSSFVNWYCGETVQGTGVAVESQGFTIVTRGKRKEPAPIKGPGVMVMYPHLQGLETKFGKGIVENLTTIVSISDSKMFPLVDFVDTPGLVDGNVEYPFDVNSVIEYLADYADLILVFLDPIGQALCSRTMSVVSALNQEHYGKMRYYLTKADTVANEGDLMKVVCQITQNLCEHIHNTHGFNVPTIFIPTDGSGAKPNAKVNGLGKLCEDIETTIHQKVQDNLNGVKDHCDAIRAEIASIESEERRLSALRSTRMRWSYFFFLLCLTVPLVLFLFALNAFHSHIPEAVSKAPWFMKAFGAMRPALDRMAAYTPEDTTECTRVAGYIAGAWLLVYLLSKFFAYQGGKYVTRTSSEMRKLRAYKASIPSMLEKQKALYTRYFQDTVNHGF